MGIDRKLKAKYLDRAVSAIDLESAKTISDLVEDFASASIQARSLARCVDVYRNMLEDKDRPVIILGLTGALIAGGLRKVIRDMVKFGLIDVIVSTGAVLYQDFYQARGYRHYVGHPMMDDVELRSLYIDRIYDTLVDEEGFEKTDRFIARITESLPAQGFSSREYIDILASYAKDESSILNAAHQRGIPVFAPALNDSSIGIGLTIYYAHTAAARRMWIDPIRDNHEMVQIILKAKKTAVIYIGGGVPKNWINDAEVMAAYAFDQSIDGHTYAFQVTTDAPHWGGLSGSTLEEAQSWGKVSPRATKATVYCEATIALPLIVGSVMQRGYAKKRKPFGFKWKGDKLVSLK